MSDVSSRSFQVDIVPSLLKAETEIAHYVANYFSHDDNVGFTGRFFEQMIEQSDPDEFTPWDLAAVSALSVNIPPRVAAKILLPGPTRDHINGLLKLMPNTTIELADATDGHISKESPAAQLYKYLRSLQGMGPAKTSKLLAAKRPRLIPIRDSVVAELLDAGDRWWAPMRHLIRDERVGALLDRVSAGAVPDSVSNLRRLDVVLWSHGST